MMELDLFEFKTALFFLPERLIPVDGPLKSDPGGTVQKEGDIGLDLPGGEAIEGFD